MGSSARVKCIKLGIQAEVQAAVHSARSIHDIFSQIANSLILKHRDLVKSQATLDLREQRSGIRFSSFEYRGKRFPALWAIQVLENALEVKNNIAKSGKLLNYELGISDV